MAQGMQLVSSSSSSCGVIQAEQRSCTASASALCGVAPQGRGRAAGCAHISMKNVGQRLLLARSTSSDADVRLMKGSGGGGRSLGKQAAAAGMVVRASSTIGVVREVSPEVKGVFTNLTLAVPLCSDVAKWYQTPGQFAQLLPVNSANESSSSFFIASPRHLVQGKELLLEFLINDVPGTVANELTNIKIGDRVIVSTNSFSTGFNVQPIQAAKSILMFAGGFGISPIRAFIETPKLIQANQREHAILYTMYAPKQEPWTSKHPAWEQSGVTVRPFENIIEPTDPASTVVLIVSFEDEQECLINYFNGKGVPHDQILTLFDGIPRTDKTYIYKVLGKPNFLHMGEQNAPFALKI